MHPDWPRALRDQCADADVAVFFKQWGAHAPEEAGHSTGALAVVDRSGTLVTHNESVENAVRMRRVGKGRAGNVFDGEVWNAFPNAACR
jgi:hypothetical protein